MAFQPKIKKLLTRPVLKMPQDVPRYVKIQAPMFIGKDIKQKGDKEDGDKKKKEPATILNVINLEDGSEAQIVCNAVLKSVLHDDYPAPNKEAPEGPDNVPAYVGKCFAITKQGRAPGKDYNPFHIAEIEDPADAKEESAGEGSPAPVHAAGGRRR
jgi:hypothetical protein